MIEFYGPTRAGTNQINVLLRLPATGREQDWEFEFSDPASVTAILTLIENNKLDADAIDAVTLLLISSIDSSKEDDLVNQDAIFQTKKWLEKNPETQKKMYFYWVKMNRSIHPEFVESLICS